jgi:putative ABC transport system permease protein
MRQIDGWFASQLIVRSSQGSPELLLNSIRRTVQEADPGQPIGLARTFSEILAIDQASRRQQMFLLIAFSGLSLVMACFGIYAILAYSVALRRQEIGIRLALGADGGRVMRLVMADGMRLAGVGAAIGVGGAWIAGRLLRASLYEVPTFDPVTLGAVCGLLGVVAIAACWIPSRRAASTSPSTVLRG